MGKNSEIQWTDHTWNIARGCTKVSEGCRYCYMMRDGEKFGYDGSIVIRTKTVFNMPLKLPRNQRSKVWPGNPLVFTSSLTDVFHPAIDPYRNEMWDIIRQRKDLTFQLLTKRPERRTACLPADWGFGYGNVWMGISAENQETLDERMRHFQGIPAEIKFLSLEPLLGPIDLTAFFKDHHVRVMGIPELSAVNQVGINYSLQKRLWVIVGGESGNDNGHWRYRSCKMDWIMSIEDQCKRAGVPLFIKQLGTHLSKYMGYKDRHGGTLSEWPAPVQIRQFPGMPI